MMKGRQYDRRFFTRSLKPHIYVIKDSNEITHDQWMLFANKVGLSENSELFVQAERLISEMRDAKIYGSIIDITPCDWEALMEICSLASEDGQISIEYFEIKHIAEMLLELINIGKALSQSYKIAITNPPYMNSSYMPAKLKEYVKNRYPVFKSDLFAVFTKRMVKMTEKNGHIGMLMPYVWMFISSYKGMRNYINDNTSITALAQLEYNAFEAACVPVAVLTFCKTNRPITGQYIKLSDFRGSENQAPKTIEAIKNKDCNYRYQARKDMYTKIPGEPIAYWIDENFANAYESGNRIGELGNASEGIKTGDNDTFLRFWFEISADKFSFGKSPTGYKWYPYHKGGEFQKWFGNDYWAINWENDGFDIKQRKNSGIQGKDILFGEFIGWSKLSSRGNPFRYYPSNMLFDSMAPGLNVRDNIKYVMGVLNSSVGINYLQVLNPTFATQVGDVKNIPIVKKNVEVIESLVNACIEITKSDWDENEWSWRFKKHPLIKATHSIKEAYEIWRNDCKTRFLKIKEYEQELNKLIISIYGMEGSLQNEVLDEDITINIIDRRKAVISFISYAIGCMFGRFSLDEEGVVYAGGEWDISRYNTFPADKDAIIPISDDEYFDDDLMNRLIEFLGIVYGKESLEDNLRFMAESLGKKGTPREAIRNYLLSGFYADHLKMYQKRPIYWLFDSGKKNGFKCLVYIHRYRTDTIARIRTDYVHEQQSRYRTAIVDLENRINGAGTSERVKLNKMLLKIQDQDRELRDYEEKIHHLADQMIAIDLDDGVKANYAKFQDVLTKIK